MVVLVVMVWLLGVIVTLMLDENGLEMVGNVLLKFVICKNDCSVLGAA